MNLSPPLAEIESTTRVVLRMNVPWYRDVPVVADVFGAYNVQFSATVDGDTTRVFIAAFPVTGKKTRDLPNRPICALSGSFDSQPEVIEGWENGFVVMALDDVKPPHLARAIVQYLLKSKQAESVRF